MLKKGEPLDNLWIGQVQLVRQATEYQSVFSTSVLLRPVMSCSLWGVQGRFALVAFIAVPSAAHSMFRRPGMVSLPNRTSTTPLHT